MSTLLNSNLFEVQRVALTKGHLKPGFAYFMEMGLGKTRVVLYDFGWHAHSKRCEILIVVCPKTLRGTWKAEAEEIDYPYPVHLFDGTSDQMLKKVLKEQGPCVVVIHYDIILSKGGDFMEGLIAKKKCMVALDESTRIKNHEAKVGERLCQLTNGYRRKRISGPTAKRPKYEVISGYPRAVYRRVLSGSPAPQGPHDLWNQFRFLEATKVNYFAWRATYCIMGGHMGKQVLQSQNLDILRVRTVDCAFRARKSEWTDLPEKLYMEPRLSEMTAEQREVYLRMMHEFVVEMGDAEITAKMAVTAKMKLQQIGSGFLYDENRVAHPLFDNPRKIPKIKDLLEFLEGASGKVLLFYHFGQTLHTLREVLEDGQFKPVFLRSGLNDDQIEKGKALFNGDDTVRLGVCQSASFKYGHTLLGTEREPCHTTGFFENTYDLEVRIQCEDRNHRHGQRHPVSYSDFVASREERKIIKALRVKSDRMDLVTKTFEDTMIESLTNEIKEINSGTVSKSDSY